MYLIGVDDAAYRSNEFVAPLCAEAMATESEHRVLARFAGGALGAPVGVPTTSASPCSRTRRSKRWRPRSKRSASGRAAEAQRPASSITTPGAPVASGTGTNQEFRTAC